MLGDEGASRGRDGVRVVIRRAKESVKLEFVTRPGVVRTPVPLRCLSVGATTILSPHLTLINLNFFLIKTFNYLAKATLQFPHLKRSLN